MRLQTSVEKFNIDKCVDAFDGNRFYLILAAAARAREIATERVHQERNGSTLLHSNKPTVESLCEIADGKVGKEYLNKIR